MIKFILHTTPTAQARPRHGTIETRNGPLHMTFKSKRQKDNEATLDALLAPYAPASPMQGPVALSFIAALPMPRSASRKLREAMLNGWAFPQKKPDLDNLAKQLKDAMTRLQFWGDDRQVVDLRCKKIWAVNGYWAVTLEPVNGWGPACATLSRHGMRHANGEWKC